MDRRRFLGTTAMMAQAAQTPLPRAGEKTAADVGETSYNVNVILERKRAGKPHQGKMLAAVQPHCDDIPIFAAGTVLKLIDEGYEGILITMSDDSMAGDGSGYGEVVWKNEKDTREVARRMGLKEAIFLNYSNHNMDAWPVIEIRARLVFLFRYFKVDTVLVYDPSGLYERNPDHYVTGQAVEWAAGICGVKWDYPEHFLAGLKPHAVRERYYFAARAAVGKPLGGYVRFCRSKSLGESGKRHPGTGRRKRRALAPAAGGAREAPSVPGR